MTLTASVGATLLEDPAVAFGGGHRAPDPKAGLALFGPWSTHIRQVNLGIVGTAETIELAQRLIDMCRQHVPGDPEYPTWKPMFPGTAASSALRCEFMTRDSWRAVLPDEARAQLEDLPRRQDRVRRAVEFFRMGIQKLQAREEPPNVYVCAPPPWMMELCMPEEGERRSRQKGRKSEAQKRVFKGALHPDQLSLSKWSAEQQSTLDEELEKLACENFHNSLKAHVMRLHPPAPTQFIRPSTLAKLFLGAKGTLQDRATICWNLSVAIYYKAGGNPWRLADLPAGTCFAGVYFYRERVGDRIGTSLAQVFTPEGEGLVLRGERFQWPSRGSPHLSAEAAERLLRRVVRAYQDQADAMPARVVVHKSSAFDANEREGMLRALEGVTRKDFVVLYRRELGVRAFRAGKNPPLRGTCIALPDGSRMLYTTGYVPHLRIYPGPGTPRPIEVRFDRADTPRDQLCREILALTRLNWNSADYASSMPMTLEFAQHVGHILKELPPGVEPETKYLFYM